MSGSSEDDVTDSLNIKPPQPKISSRTRGNHHRDQGGSSRDRDSYRSTSLNSKGHYKNDGTRYQENWRQNNFQYSQHHSRDRPDRISDQSQQARSSRHQRDRRIEYDNERPSSSTKRKYEGKITRNVDEIPAAGYNRNSTSDKSVTKISAEHKDERSKQLHRSQEKRKHLEEEEERTMREIEKKRRREKKNEMKKHSSVKRRREKSESLPENKSSDEEATRQPAEKREHVKSSKKHVDDEHSGDEDSVQIPIVEDIDRSSSEAEDASKEVKHIPGIPYHSDVSSEESEHEPEPDKKEMRPSSNANSDVSSRSEASRSSSSKSDTNSDNSSSSTDDEDQRTKQKNEARKGSNKKKTKTSYYSLSDENNRSENLSTNKELDVEMIEVERKIEPKDESLLTDVDRAIRQVGLLPPYYPAVHGCRRVEEFSLLNRIEEGTYGVVYRAKDKRTNEIVALKRLKMEKERDGFPITSLREINTLLKAQHENIVTVREIVVGSNTDKIFLVMDYVEHDLKALMETLKQKDQKFIMGEVKCLMLQLLRAVAHLHDNWILHRDLKTSNLLLSHKGILKVGDFGLAREYGSPLKGYTPIVVTLWYRAPELLLGTKEYSTPIDVWSVGCIFGELLKMEPMFPGKSEANQLNLIFQTLGTPNDRIWPGYSKLPLLQKMTFVEQPMNKLKTRFGISELGIDLMNKFLTYCPAKRITAEDALRHPFFKEAPLPIDPSVFPTWPAKSELGHKKAHSSPKPPSGGRQFKDLRDDDDPSGFFLGIGDRRPPIGAGFSLKF